MRKSGAIFLALMLAGCAAGNDPFANIENNPAAIDPSDRAEDGLIVGHRLMAAGEYDLALRAYYRAGAEYGMTADVLSAIGSANLRLGRLGQAETGLRQAIDADPDFAAAWNNLGVVLMEMGDYGQARRIFERAFAIDSGQSDPIRENLRLAMNRMENNVYIGEENNEAFDLVRRGGGRYVLLQTP